MGKISQETLADMIPTTRARVSFFMNKFRKLGSIDYNGHLEVHNSLLNVVLYDKPESHPNEASGPHGACSHVQLPEAAAEGLPHEELLGSKSKPGCEVAPASCEIRKRRIRPLFGRQP